MAEDAEKIFELEDHEGLEGGGLREEGRGVDKEEEEENQGERKEEGTACRPSQDGQAVAPVGLGFVGECFDAVEELGG